ncbi:BgTH12-06309 [Blumeria graminis f. sp. triticale]|uniref:BgTH12-06309 n=1 Tax=Blumeria graminis f. sp. triticale TaxID=1689686 RepID=A0A9W4CXZ1_BLUGR|nr:BgTH12-06309 [Blumeria graminis f. sp. triticale]
MNGPNVKLRYRRI